MIAKKRYENISDIYKKGYELIQCGSTCATQIQDFFSEAQHVIREVDPHAQPPSFDGGMTVRTARHFLDYMYPIMEKAYQDALKDQERDSKENSPRFKKEAWSPNNKPHDSAQEKYENISDVYKKGYELIQCGSTCATQIQDFFSEAQHVIRQIDPHEQPPSFDGEITVRHVLDYMYPIMEKAYQDALEGQERDSKEDSARFKSEEEIWSQSDKPHDLAQEKSAQEKYMTIFDVYERGFGLIKPEDTCDSACEIQIQGFFSEAQQVVRAVDPHAQPLSFYKGTTVRQILNDMYPIVEKAYQKALEECARFKGKGSEGEISCGSAKSHDSAQEKYMNISHEPSESSFGLDPMDITAHPTPDYVYSGFYYT